MFLFQPAMNIEIMILFSSIARNGQWIYSQALLEMANDFILKHC